MSKSHSDESILSGTHPSSASGRGCAAFVEEIYSRPPHPGGIYLSAAGSLTQYTIRFANQPEGNHIHLSVSDSTGRTTGGHLLDGNLVYTTLEVVIGEDLDHSYQRETDSTFGYKELVIKKKNN